MLISKETKSAIKIVVLSAIDTRVQIKLSKMRRDREDIDDKIEAFENMLETVKSISHQFMHDYMRSRSARMNSEEHVH